ncbi:MAG TPA: hypothetical protein VJT67_12280 [Longimicrobiaceae bacterium]|nr:hypothetical protein [Longimicrobiaceae bacterium]
MSDRPQVQDELRPILAFGHALTPVPDGGKALRMLHRGAVPGAMISDLGSDRSLHALEYLWRFREVNRTGAAEPQPEGAR